MPLKKYQLTADAPVKFGIVLPEYGFQEFISANLTDHEAEALLKAKCPYIKEAKEAKDQKP